MRSMLAPWPAIRAGDGRDGAGQQGSAQDDDGGPAAAAGGVVARAGAHLDLHAEPRRDVADDRPQQVVPGTRSQQHRERQMPTDDDLLEVQDLGADVGDGVEQGAGDAGTVIPGDRHQQGLGLELWHADRLGGAGFPIRPVSPCDQVAQRPEVVVGAADPDGEQARARRRGGARRWLPRPWRRTPEERSIAAGRGPPGRTSRRGRRCLCAIVPGVAEAVPDVGVLGDDAAASCARRRRRSAPGSAGSGAGLSRAQPRGRSAAGLRRGRRAGRRRCRTRSRTRRSPSRTSPRRCRGSAGRR